MITTLSSIMKKGKAPENLTAIDLPHEEPTYCASDNLKSFRQLNNGIFMLYFALMAFVYLEASDKTLSHTRSTLILILVFFLVLISFTILEHPLGHGGLLQAVIMMVMACPVCVLFVLFISTITAVITFILWAIAISIVVSSRWNEIVEQMAVIRIAVAKKWV